MIKAGTQEQITWGDRNWIFFDVGFSADKYSSGLLIGDDKPSQLQFGEAKSRIVQHVKDATSPTKLVIEAPLSVCFNKNNNPTGRLKIEKESVGGKTKTRYWHNEGCRVMVAALYLVRQIADATTNEVCLFEGFVSFKDGKGKSNHRADVLLLREVVQRPEQFANCIIGPDKLCGPDERIVSAFNVCGIDCGVPPVIKRQPPRTA